jgi:RimJ/RimL family protein N-acetyltransferase
LTFQVAIRTALRYRQGLARRLGSIQLRPDFDPSRREVRTPGCGFGNFARAISTPSRRWSATHKRFWSQGVGTQAAGIALDAAVNRFEISRLDALA